MKAIDSMWSEIVEPTKDENYEFLSEGTMPTTTLAKMVTPITYESGTPIFVGKIARHGIVLMLNRELCRGHCNDR